MRTAIQNFVINQDDCPDVGMTLHLETQQIYAAQLAVLDQLILAALLNDRSTTQIEVSGKLAYKELDPILVKLGYTVTRRPHYIAGKSGQKRALVCISWKYGPYKPEEVDEIPDSSPDRCEEYIRIVPKNLPTLG